MSFPLTVAKRTSAKNSKPNASTSSSSAAAWPIQLTLPTADPTLEQLKRAIAKQRPRLVPQRQRITTEDKRALLDDQLTMKQLGVRPGDVVYLKDLGPQVAWSTVFLTEYAGPLLIHPLVYYYSNTIYRRQFVHSRMQTIALGLVVLHYAKRELETLFVHRFSNGTMPLRNIFKNSAHYWILSGVFLAGAVYGPWASAPALRGTLQDSPLFLYACVALWTVGQLGNFYSHLILKNLRPAGTRQRKIPRGFAFELVSCPNYFFETITWLSFTALTLSWASLLFSAVSVAQMYVWAVKKHKNYRKEFKDYPRGRKAMFPFIA